MPPKKKAKMSTENVNVVLFGVGGVGRCLVTQIIGARAAHASRYGVQFNVVALADSSGYVSAGGAALSDEQLQAANAFKAEGKKFKDHTDGKAGSPDDALAVASGKFIAVDCSATDSITPTLIKALNQGGGLAFANKKTLTVDQASFTEMTSPKNIQRLRYESSVGAGTPMVAVLSRLMECNDKPSLVQGTFSGTLGYVMTGLGEGTPFSQVVNKAGELGYTEPDPRDDLGGVDVGRKALILARTMGLELEMTDVEIEPLYPESLASVSIPDFIQALPTLDADFAAKSAAAAAEGKVLRYTASIKDGKCKVGLVALPSDSPIGRLVGADNMIEYHTEIYGDKPLVVQGAGAGGPVTAAGVLSDMVSIVPCL